MTDLRAYLDEEGFRERSGEEIDKVLAQHPAIIAEFDRMRRGEATQDFYVFASQIINGVSLYDFLKSRSRILVEWRVERIARYASAKSRIVDAGCGTGLEAAFFSHLASMGEVTGIDSSEAMLRLARERTARRRLGNLRFLNADMENMPIETGSQDLVYCMEALYDNRPGKDNDAMAKLHEFRRILRTGGRLVFTLHSEAEDSCDRSAGYYEGILDCLSYRDFTREKGYHIGADGMSTNHILVSAEKGE
jgi:SAM-dependent methyltransferase